MIKKLILAIFISVEIIQVMWAGWPTIKSIFEHGSLVGVSLFLVITVAYLALYIMLLKGNKWAYIYTIFMSGVSVLGATILIFANKPMKLPAYIYAITFFLFLISIRREYFPTSHK